MRYGIPDFKLAKSLIDRRIGILKKEGIKFVMNTDVGVTLPASGLMKGFDATCLSIGSRVPRDLTIEGRDLAGIHFAMDYLIKSNRRISAKEMASDNSLDAKGKKVLVIGGGDTGADCVGTAHRQGASCVMQIEVLPKPADCRTPDFPWPKYPTILKTSTSHEEGGIRSWAVLTKKFIGDDNAQVKKVVCAKLDFSEKDAKGCPVMKEIPGSGFEIEADLVILAIGFVHPEHRGLLKELNIEFDGRGNIKTGPDYMTSVKNVFASGDARRGQSLIVWAISEGRRAAHSIDKYLMGTTNLPII
jgi:glutamate synthase (NADPH/NADH) small chain